MTGYQSKKKAAQDKLDSREREALKRALKALEGFIPYLPLKDEAQCNRYDLATTTIKAALAQPAQEPVGFVDSKLNPIQRPLVLQREWVDLTDEEIDKWAHELHGVIYAVMAELKEKNT